MNQAQPFTASVASAAEVLKGSNLTVPPATFIAESFSQFFSLECHASFREGGGVVNVGER